MNLSKIKIEKSLINDDLFVFRINDSMTGHIHKVDLEDLFKQMVDNNIGKNYLDKRYLAMNKSLINKIKSAMVSSVSGEHNRAKGILCSLVGEINSI